LYAAANSVLALQATHHHNFDWYSAPIATHHTEQEVAHWMHDEGLTDTVDDSPLDHGDSYYARIYPAWARRADGSLKAGIHALCPHWALTVRGRIPAMSSSETGVASP
jgi:hypothetical protein